MKLSQEWELTASNVEIEIFNSMTEKGNYMIRDCRDNSIICTFSLENNTIEISEIGWAVSLKVDWEKKIIHLNYTEEIV